MIIRWQFLNSKVVDFHCGDPALLSGGRALFLEQMLVVVIVYICLFFHSCFHSLSLSQLYAFIHQICYNHCVDNSFGRSLDNIKIILDLCNHILFHRNRSCLSVFDLQFDLRIGLSIDLFSSRCDLVYKQLQLHINRLTVSGRNCACIDLA